MRRLKTHEIANLDVDVASPGIFATAGASNPTYTIFVLSLRGAEHLATNCKWRMFVSANRYPLRRNMR